MCEELNYVVMICVYMECIIVVMGHKFLYVCSVKELNTFVDCAGYEIKIYHYHYHLFHFM